MNDDYVRTVQLLLTVAPEVFANDIFAMKGGTALNLFVQDMPRLSVDIDVVFVPHTMPRDLALKTIGDELATVKARLEKLGLAAELRKTKDGDEVKMAVTSQDAEVKVEVNFVFRGTVLPRCELHSRRPRRKSSVPTSKCRCWPLPSSMAASWSQHWTASIRGICSTFS